MGCDKPAKREHVLNIGGEEIRTRTCPRKMMAPSVPFIRTFNWAKAGNLAQLYKPGELPAYVAEAIDVFNAEQARLLNAETKKK